MLLPYSTDAPIYYFPWMTIVLIVVNCITFAITRMGLQDEGWLLQYGNGLHPVEWLAYNFLHFGPIHLIGNMFFLWAFGIVVEGKLGWWKFLAVYLGIGILGGLLIQLVMLGYRPKLDVFGSTHDPPHWSTWFDPPSAMAQEDDMDWDDNEEKIPGEDRNFEEELTPEQEARLREEIMAHLRPGAGGASLIVFGLLGMVLVWAPKNEVSCFFVAGFRAGTFEIEYIYFCGFKIAFEIIGAIWGVQGYEVTSEVGHAIGAGMGFSLGTLFLKMDWVDCENWDLFAFAQNKHGSAQSVGAWQDTVVYRREKKFATPEGDGIDLREARPKAKKKKAKPKLKELQSFDDDMSDDEEPAEDVFELGDDALIEPPKPARKPAAASNPGLKEIRLAIKEGELEQALAAFRRMKAANASFELPKAELSCLADGFFKAHNIRDGRVFLEDYVRRFPDDADRHRVKLAVLYVKHLKKPKAALKLLAVIDKKSLPPDYQPVYQQAGRQAQQMIADGLADAT